MVLRSSGIVDSLEQRMIKQCKHNNREAYNTLFKNYEAYIYTICYRYTNSQEDALDLLQDVFIKIYQSIGKFEEGRPLLPWIKRITVNTCLNHVRSHKMPLLSLQQSIDEDENTLENMIADDTDVATTVVLADTKAVLQQTIAGLPAEMKLAIILRHVDGMSYQEIGKTMSAPVGTIKTYLHRGRNILREKLKQYGIGEAQ